MGSSGGSSSSGGGTYTMRYADYIETHHKTFLNDTYTYRGGVIKANPFSGREDVPVDDGFFGVGYALSSFPALFDMYGKFVAGLDVDALWEEILVGTTTESAAAASLVSTESKLLNDELYTKILPQYMAGMRDLNAINSSSFIVGKALLMDTKYKQVAKFSAELKWKLIGTAVDRYKSHLAWNMEVVNTYSSILKHFFAAKLDVERFNYEANSKNALWPLTVMDYERANLGALQGAIKQSTDKDSGSFLGGALSGAAAGGMIAGPWGALGGAVLGGVASLL